MRAANAGNPERVADLLDNGADPFETDEDGWTALTWALSRRGRLRQTNVACAQALLARLRVPANQCPVCDKTFEEGGFHHASMKLHSHMAHGRFHKRARRCMAWEDEGELTYGDWWARN